MDRAIIVEKLVKNFSASIKKEGILGSFESLIKPKKKLIKALKSISFSVNRGECVGFIGPNGAGKTTTLKILSGLLYPTAGFVQVLGFDPWKKDQEFLKSITLVMGQKNQLWWDLPAIETLKLNKEIYEIKGRDYKETLNQLVDLLEVGKLLNIQVRRLSLGQRMRLELIAALLHKPKILFLDEPTIGLDVVAQQKIREFIVDYNKKNNATILLTSHNMNDLYDVADRVLVIDKGELKFDGNFKELVSNFARKKLIDVYFSKEIDIKKLEEIGEVKKISFPHAVIEVPRETSALAASELLQNFPVNDLTIQEESVEDVVRKIFKKSGI